MKYVESGLQGLSKPITRVVNQKLSLEDKQRLKDIIINKYPIDYGYDKYLWTGQTLEELILKEFKVELKDSRIYEVLNELGLSHQKAHRDYDNADKDKQIEFQEDLKKNFKVNRTWKIKGNK